VEDLHTHLQVVAQFIAKPAPQFIHVAVLIDGHSPFSCRGYAVRMEPDNSVLSVYILRSQWLRIHDTVQQGQWLAVLLTSGSDNESYQVKGPFAGYRSLDKEDSIVLERQKELMLQTFPNLASLLAVDPRLCLAVELRVESVYIQTPGPHAGSLVTERRP